MVAQFMKLAVVALIVPVRVENVTPIRSLAEDALNWLS
jgi:hypothetical protein